MFADGYDFGFLTEGEKRALAIQCCNGQVGMGESSQPSSPLEVTFWSMHCTVERLLMSEVLHFDWILLDVIRLVGDVKVCLELECVV